MKSIAPGRRSLALAVSALLGLLVMIHPLSLRAGSSETMMLGFGMLTDQFYIGLVKNDGTPLRRVTQNGFALDPYFSPDGRSLFFCDNAKTNFGTILQIYRLDLDESRMVTLISDGSAVDEWPVCSPDGKQLAFISRIAEPSKDKSEDLYYRVYVSDISGKDRKLVDPEGDAPQYFPSWSPDGTKIVYTVARFLMGSRLMIRDLEHKTTTRLLPFYIFACQGSWSPQSDLIAYTDMVPLTGKRSIWVVKPDGSDRKAITQGPDDQNPFWYPDGSKLLFSRNQEGQEKGESRRVICSVDLKTGEVKTIISMDDGNLDTPRIVALPDAGPKPQASQTPAAKMP